MAFPYRPRLPPRNSSSTTLIKDKLEDSPQQIDKYQYEAIPQAHGSAGIRVLELLNPRSSDGKRIECKLHLVSLDDLVEQNSKARNSLTPAPPFTALSYCWGENVRSEHIYCNGSRIAITKNLAAILQYLVIPTDVDEAATNQSQLFPARSRYLWIDAICIDQDDLDERQQQVRLMPRIYTRAEKTMIWLGQHHSKDAGNNSARLLREVAKMDRKYSADRWSFSNRFRGVVYSEGWEPKLKDVFGEDFEVSMEATRELYQSPWFSRAWIVQELALSRSIEVQFGNHIMSWQDIVDAAPTFYLRGMISFSPHLKSHVESATLPVLLDKIRHRYEKGYSMQLFDLLQSLRYRMASDPRDLIYSLLGLVSTRDSDQHGIEPNYQPAVTSADVFLRVAHLTLRTKRNLQLLECANHYTVNKDMLDSSSSLNLPSWVPNWEIRGKDLPFLDHTSPTVFMAGGDVSPLPSLRAVNRLVLNGITEVITKCSGLWPSAQPGDHFSQSNMDRDREFYHGLQSLEDFVTSASNFPSRYCTGESSIEVLLQTILAGRPTSDMEQVRKQWVGLMNVMKRDTEAHAKFERARKSSYIAGKLVHAQVLVQEGYWAGEWFLRSGQFEAEQFGQMIAERRLAWSSEHMLSMVPQATVPGDLLLIARGARLTFVVRPLESGAYHLVGPAYTHGYMKGEAWTRERLRQVREIVLT